MGDIPDPSASRAGGWGGSSGLTAVWDVGVRLGAALRRAYHDQDTAVIPDTTETGRARPRAHVRVAHWHTYLTGEGRVNRVLRWIPPVPVNVGSLDSLPASVRVVRP